LKVLDEAGCLFASFKRGRNNAEPELATIGPVMTSADALCDIRNIDDATDINFRLKEQAGQYRL
jgi:hypothetical protein